MRLAHHVAALDRAPPLRLTGRLTQVSGLALEAAMAGVKLGDLVEVERPGQALLAEVVGLREERAVLLPKVARQAVDSLYAGEVVLGQGDTLGRPEALRVLGFGAVVERLVASALALRHPDHRAVMARGEGVPESAEEALYAHFFPEGESEGGLPLPSAAMLDGVLAPLGLAEKRGRGFRLVTDPGRSPALAALTGLIAGQAAQAARRGKEDGALDMASVRTALAKGRLGLDARAVRLTVAAAVFGGLAVPVSGGRRVPLGRLTGPDAVDRVEGLRPGGGGEGGAVPAALARLPFLRESADGPFLPAKQRELWARTVKWKAERGDPAAEAEALAELGRHPVLQGWHLEPAVAALALCGRLVAAIQVSLPAAEGLGRLERQSAEEGEAAAGAVAEAEGWSAFVRHEVRLLLEGDRYLAHPALAALGGQGAEWRRLEEERASLARRLRAAPGLLEPAARAAWREEFARFVDAYRQRYLAAHRSAVGEDPGPALGALERKWPGAAGDPRAHAERAAVLARHCTLAPARALDVEPLCPCGYRIGAPPLTQGIAAYADLLAAIEREGGEAAGLAPAPVPFPAPAAQARVSAAASAASATSAPEPGPGASPGRTATRAAARRSAAALVESLRAAGNLRPSEARRRFERWLDAAGDDPLVIDP